MTFTKRDATAYRRQLIGDGCCRIPAVAPAELIGRVRQVANRVMEAREFGAGGAHRIQHTCVELWNLPEVAPLIGLPAALDVLAVLGYARPRYYSHCCRITPATHTRPPKPESPTTA